MQLFYGMIAGLPMWTHMAFPMMFGAILRRLVFEKRFGKKNWLAYAPVLLAGYSCGIGLVGMSACGIALIAKAVSQIVF